MRKGVLPRLYRHIRQIATASDIIPTDPSTVVRIMIRFLCRVDILLELASDIALASESIPNSLWLVDVGEVRFELLEETCEGAIVDEVDLL